MHILSVDFLKKEIELILLTYLFKLKNESCYYQSRKKS